MSRGKFSECTKLTRHFRGLGKWYLNIRVMFHEKLEIQEGKEQTCAFWRPSGRMCAGFSPVCQLYNLLPFFQTFSRWLENQLVQTFIVAGRRETVKLFSNFSPILSCITISTNFFFAKISFPPELLKFFTIQNNPCRLNLISPSVQ